MNGLMGSAAQIRDLLPGLREVPPTCDVVICPPMTLLMPFSLILEGYSLSLGAQDCHAEIEGAYTGDTSADMLRDAGCAYVIVGHSERRSAYAETDSQVSAKARAAHEAGLAAIICVGESWEDREGGTTIEVVAAQLRDSIPDNATAQNTVIAYEPIWAIGSGKTPSPADIAEVHGMIRQHVTGRFGDDGREFRLIYGGSVGPTSAAGLLNVANVDGALVGGASLDARDFDAILDVYRSE